MTKTEANSSANSASRTPLSTSTSNSVALSRCSSNSSVASSRRLRSSATIVPLRRAMASERPPVRRGSCASATKRLATTDQKAHQETDRRGNAQRLPGIVAHVFVGRARGRFGPFRRVILHVLQLELGGAQLGFDLRAQIGRAFARFLGGLLEQRIGFGQHFGEILDQRVAA